MAELTEYLIWSTQHAMWWRAGERGYTTRIQEAGRYPRALAEKIVSAATLDGALKRQMTDSVTGRQYAALDEYMVLAPECA